MVGFCWGGSIAHGLATRLPGLNAAGARFELHPYPGTRQGFNDDTMLRYGAAAAKLACERRVGLLKRHLAAPS